MKKLYEEVIQNPKFCFDCKNFLKDDVNGDISFSKCKKFVRAAYYYVNGDPTRLENFHYCNTARNSDFLCGAHALYFEPTHIDIDGTVIVDQLMLTDDRATIKIENKKLLNIFRFFKKW